MGRASCDIGRAWSLPAAVSDAEVHCTEELTLEQIIGGIYSAFHADQLPKQAERAAFADRIGTALQSHAPYIEDVTVRLLIGCAPLSELKSYGSGSASAMGGC